MMPWYEVICIFIYALYKYLKYHYICTEVNLWCNTKCICGRNQTETKTFPNIRYARWFVLFLLKTFSPACRPQSKDPT